MKTKRLCVWMLPIVLFTVVALPAAADVFLKQISHSSAFQAMGKNMEAQTDTVHIWFGESKARMNSGESNSVILLADPQMLYIIDHEDKTFSPISLAEGLEGMLPDDMSEEDAAMMKQMMSSMAGSMKLTVTPTDETKKIREWNARKHIVDLQMTMGSSHSETWASEDIQLDAKFFNQMSMAAMAFLPGMAEAMKEMEKIKGFPVYTKSTTDMMGTKVERTEELVEFAHRPAPADTYQVPAGYKEKSIMER